MDQEAKYWRDKWSESQQEIEALRKLLSDSTAKLEELKSLTELSS